MTAPEVEAVEPVEEDRTVAERWTYAGQAPGRKRAVIEVWWDASGERLAFAPGKGFHGTPGGLYEVQVERHGNSVTRHGGATFVGANPDREVRAAAEAEAQAGGRELARNQLERRVGRGGPLAEVLAEVEATAGPMTHRQRDAFVSLLQRSVYMATRGGR